MYSEALITGQGLSLGEALSEGLKVTGVGLVVVFAVLVILMILLMLFKVVFYRPESKQSADAEETKSAPIIEEVTAEDGDIDDEELVAVLTAAVAACMNTSTYKLRIKSYRRIDNNGSAWNKAGLRETINSRF